jgi:MFS-type transporter involved in bile tolerance (Atg22 family)
MFRYLITNGLDGIQGYLVSLALTLPIILFSLTLHECAHGWMAMKLGDRTAYNLGRLTLNPIKHLDPIGFVCMLLAGFGWATISINSFPMVVELARGGDVGKYTGYYYTASMAAQILTPILSGAFMQLSKSMTVLFPYATFFVALSFLAMLFVRHGDARPTATEVIETALSAED